MTEELDKYFQRLTNLAGNNSSLLLLNLPREFFLDLKSLDHFSGLTGFEVIDWMISGRESIQIAGRDQQNKLLDQISSIHHHERIIFEEKGGKDLYVGWPSVQGKFMDGAPVRCPLIFFPVTLVTKEDGWGLQRRKSVNVTLNKTFLLRYAYHNQVKLDDELVELVLNDFDTDSTLFRTRLYEVLKLSTLNIGFNKENFIDDLLPFDQLTREGLMKSETEGQLQLYPQAVLGIFPQSGAYLVSDYSKLLKEGPNRSLDQFLAPWIENEQKGKEIDYPVKEENIFTAFSLDSYQEAALHSIKSRKSLMVQGPPGTGKTQMICNMITDFIARGKNVLFVSQKRVALDIAYQRLQSRELHDFVGLVQDFKNDRQVIYTRILKQIESIDEYRQKNQVMDSAGLEKSFLDTSRRIDAINDELEEFKRALFDEGECGKSIKELYLISNRELPFILLNQIYRSFDFKRVEEFLPRLRGFIRHFRKFDGSGHFWAEGSSFAGFGDKELERIQLVVEEVYEFEKGLRNESKSFTKNEIDFETALFFLTNREPLEQLAANLKNETTYSFYIHMVDNPPQADLTWLSKMERTMLQCFKGSGLEASLPAEDLGRFQEALEHAIRSRKDLFNWLRWRLFSADKIFITRVLVANDLRGNKGGFQTLLEKIDNRLNFEHLVSEIRDTGWLKGFPDSFRVIDIQNWFFYQKLALKSYQLRHLVPSLPNYILAKDETRKRYVDTIHQLINLVDKIPKQQKKWGKYISEAQIRLLLLEKVDKEHVLGQLREDYHSLVEYHTYRDSFDPEERKMVEEFIEMEAQGDGQVEDLFINSISLAWIDHIEQKYPVLKMDTSTRLNELSNDLQQYVGEKMRMSRDLVLLNIRKRTYETLDYGNTNFKVTYAELVTFLTNPVNKWPIRRLIANYQEEIFSLLPCWMTTPETASALFPMEKVFDLVIFDEASQCLPERAIPTIFRGHKVMVVGDDMQLLPNQLFSTSHEPFEGQPKLKDSLLQMVKGHFEEVALKQHYRSKSEVLIRFSNKHFYQDRLRFIPYFIEAGDLGRIRYQKVEGVEVDGRNEVEGIEVMGMIKKLLLKPTDKRIGVIVPGIEQQTLLWSMLREYEMEEGEKIPDSLFVKVIDNVQGNEGDIIIFSTVWDARNAPERFFRTQNQINVVATRAKESLVVVTSLQHDTLKNEANPGVRSLKEFLAYASGANNGSLDPYPLILPDPRPERLLKNYMLKQLNGAHFLVDELPFADGVIRKKGKYYGAVISDDQLVDESPKEAFCHKLNLLRERKWPFIQFSSREFWAERTLSFEKLEKFTKRETN